MRVPECPYRACGVALWVSEVSNLLQWGCATEFCVFLLLLTPGLLSSLHVAVRTLGSLLLTAAMYSTAAWITFYLGTLPTA